jgi:Xaa-Pro aminopeptidase
MPSGRKGTKDATPAAAAEPAAGSLALAEYAARRERVLAGLDGAVGLVLAGKASGGDEPFRAEGNFEYLTGIDDEPGAALLLDRGHPDATRRAMLFLAPLNPEREQWDGYREGISEALRRRYGIQAIYRSDVLPRMLTAAARRSRRLACLHPPAPYDQPVSPDLAIFRAVAERIPGVAIESTGALLESMRAVKSPGELGMIERAIAITAAGFEAMFRAVRPGVLESEVQHALESAYRARGARGPAFPSIVGAGRNSTVLHYRANDRRLAEGDLVCVDSGARFGGYGADVTRTVPASGSFSARQREVYDVVLEAHGAAIAALRPGATFGDVDAAARDVIAKAGFGDFFIHGIGHHLGLRTHDASPDEPLKAGAVFTIEPGIYIPEESLGVRIEDDVLVTARGARILTGAIPRAAEDVERAMQRR